MSVTLCPIHGLHPFPGCCAKEVEGDEIVFITDSGEVIDFDLVDEDETAGFTIDDAFKFDAITTPTKKGDWLETERLPRHGTVKFSSEFYDAILTDTHVTPGDYLLFEKSNSYVFVTHVHSATYEGADKPEFTVYYDFIGQKNKPEKGEAFTIIESKQPTALVESEVSR